MTIFKVSINVMSFLLEDEVHAQGEIAAPIPLVMSSRDASLPAVEAAVSSEGGRPGIFCSCVQFVQHASTPPSRKSSGSLKLSDLVLPMMAYSVDE